MVQRIFFCLLVHCIVTGLFAVKLHAEGPSVTVKGASVNLDFKPAIDRFTFPLSQDDLRRLAMEITNVYHENGYTTSYAEKVIVKKNGDVEIQVRESRIAEVSVLGIKGESAKKISKILSPEGDEPYNSIAIKNRAEYAAKILKLSSIKINVVNIDNSADVMLKVEARASEFGSARLKMQYEPIYGLSPFLAYDQKWDDVAISLSGSLSVKDSEYRKKYTGAMITYSNEERLLFYTKYEWSASLETWKEAQQDFRTLSNRPSLGMKYMLNRNIFFELSSILDLIVLENYRNTQNSFHDVSFSLSGHYTDAPDVIVPGDDTGLSMKFSVTRSDLEKKYFIDAGFSFHALYSPLAWMNIRPSLAGNYTGADERYYRWYVYDESFPVKSDDYAATHARISGNLYFEFEAYPEMLYLGPIGYQSFFYNETAFELQSVSAIGICTRIIAGRFTIHALCLVPADKMNSNPVFLFSANGLF